MKSPFSHDLDGNLTNDCVFTYSYDAANRLLSVSSNGVVLVANQYDYKGRRIRKTTPTTETTFVYDGWNLIHEAVATFSGATTNTTEIQYFWGADISETLQGAGGVGGLLAVSLNNNFYFPTYDNNGNVSKYIDESGNIVAAYEYDDFGKTISQSGSLADFFRHRFSTKYFDSETGLYYYGYRFYSPSLMRWLNRDPIGEGGGKNLYTFCGNKPIYVYDIDGCAYFAYRPLQFPVVGRGIGIHGRNRLNEHDNKVMAHEQLVFEDNGDIINIGYGSDGMIQDEDMTGYVPKEKSGYYNDCIMHRAVDNVTPKPYSMLSWGSSIAILNRITPVQYNCQDYADDLRREYDRLMKDPCERKKCGLK